MGGSAMTSWKTTMISTSGEAARVYLGIRVQLTVAGLIGGNFLMNIIETLGSAMRIPGLVVRFEYSKGC